jgi:hypothetical protein
MRRSLWVRWVLRMRRKLQLCDDGHAGAPRGRSGPRRRSPDGRHGVWSEAPCARAGGTALDSSAGLAHGPSSAVRGFRGSDLRAGCAGGWGSVGLGRGDTDRGDVETGGGSGTWFWRCCDGTTVFGTGQVPATPEGANAAACRGQPMPGSDECHHLMGDVWMDCCRKADSRWVRPGTRYEDVCVCKKSSLPQQPPGDPECCPSIYRRMDDWADDKARASDRSVYPPVPDSMRPRCGPDITGWMYHEVWAQYMAINALTLDESSRPLASRWPWYWTLIHRSLGAFEGKLGWKRNLLSKDALDYTDCEQNCQFPGASKDDGPKVGLCGLCVDNSIPANIAIPFVGRTLGRSESDILSDFDALTWGAEPEWDRAAQLTGFCLFDLMRRVSPATSAPNAPIPVASNPFVFLSLDLFCWCIRRNNARYSRDHCDRCPRSLPPSDRARAIVSQFVNGIPPGFPTRDLASWW